MGGAIRGRGLPVFPLAEHTLHLRGEYEFVSGLELPHSIWRGRSEHAWALTAKRDREGLHIPLRPGDHVYGLGDKAGAMDRRGRAFTMWNTDAYAWDAARDPLYKSIPSS